MFEGIGDASDLQPVFVNSFKKKYLKPDMIKRWLRDSKRRNRRFQDSVENEESQDP